MAGLAHGCQWGPKDTTWESLVAGLVSVGRAPCSQTPRGHSASRPSEVASKGGGDTLGTRERETMLPERLVLSPHYIRALHGPGRAGCSEGLPGRLCCPWPLPVEGGCSDGVIARAKGLGWGPWLCPHASQPLLQHEPGLTRHLLGVMPSPRQVHHERNKESCPGGAHPPPREPETLWAHHQPSPMSLSWVPPAWGFCGSSCKKGRYGEPDACPAGELGLHPWVPGPHTDPQLLIPRPVPGAGENTSPPSHGSV